ncbi:hypothetical protein ACVMIX_004338 [Rhizobium leguminosarum]
MSVTLNYAGITPNEFCLQAAAEKLMAQAGGAN